MGLIKLNDDSPKEATVEGESKVVRRVDVRDALPNDNAEIVELLLTMLNHLNLDYIRIEKGVINYVHYPDYKREE